MAAIHSDEFKRDPVRIALTSGLTRPQVASDLGVGHSTLGRRVRAFSEESKVPAQDAELLRENERLRKENRILREEREVLKNRHGSQPACARYKQPVLPSMVWRAVADRLLEGQTPLKNVAHELMRT